MSISLAAYLNAKKNDLSDFELDFKDCSLNCISREDTFEIYINDQLAYTKQLPDIVEKIRDFSIHFEGAGALKNVALGATSGIVYTTTSAEVKS